MMAKHLITTTISENLEIDKNGVMQVSIQPNVAPFFKPLACRITAFSDLNSSNITDITRDLTVTEVTVGGEHQIKKPINSSKLDTVHWRTISCMSLCKELLITLCNHNRDRVSVFVDLEGVMLAHDHDASHQQDPYLQTEINEAIRKFFAKKQKRHWWNREKKDFLDKIHTGYIKIAPNGTASFALAAPKHGRKFQPKKVAFRGLSLKPKNGAPDLAEVPYILSGAYIAYCPQFASVLCDKQRGSLTTHLTQGLGYLDAAAWSWVSVFDGCEPLEFHAFNPWSFEITAAICVRGTLSDYNPWGRHSRAGNYNSNHPFVEC